MTRITKKIAEDCSNAALVKLMQKQQRLEKMFEEYAKQVYMDLLPDAIKIAFQDHQCKPYIFASKCVYLTGQGIAMYECDVSTEHRLPYVDPLKVSPDQAKELRQYMDKISSLKSQISGKRREIQITLLGLGTYARVEKEFPEVYQYLPTSQNPTLPAKNLEPLRNFIKNL